MLETKFVRENSELIKENMNKKSLDVSVVDDFLKNDSKVRELMNDAQSLRHSRNTLSQRISEAKKKGDGAGAAKIMKEAKEVPNKIAAIEKKASIFE